MEKNNQFKDLMLLLEQLLEDYQYFPDKVHIISKKHIQMHSMIKENDIFYENLQTVVAHDDVYRLGKKLQQITESYQWIVQKRDSVYDNVYREIQRTFQVTFNYDEKNIGIHLLDFVNFFFEKSLNICVLRDLQYPNTLGYQDVEYFGRSLPRDQKIDRLKYALEDFYFLCNDIKQNIDLILTQSSHIYQIYFQDQEIYSYFGQEKVQQEYIAETERIKTVLSNIYNKLVTFSYNFYKEKEAIADMMSQFRCFHTDKFVVTPDSDLQLSFTCLISDGPFRGLIPIFEKSIRYKKY